MLRLIPLFLLFIVGCSGGTGPSLTAVENRLKLLSQLYARYTSTHRGVPPASEKVFRDFINGLEQAEKTKRNISTADDVLVSPSDKKPFLVKYTTKVSNVAPGKGEAPGQGPGNTIIAAESSGSSRYAVYMNGNTTYQPESDINAQLK